MSTAGGSDRDRRLRKLYIENVGHEPRELPEDHPDRWQWDYRGRSDEDKERLKTLLWQEPAVELQEETLF